MTNGQHRQDALMVKAPMMGLVARPSWPIPMFSPIKSASFLVRKTAEMVATVLFATPAARVPANMRPTMNMGGDWAAPHMAFPGQSVFVYLDCIFFVSDIG